MDTPTLEQIAYRWNNGDSLPGVDRPNSARSIEKEIREKATAQFEQERRRLLDEAYKSLGD